MARVRRGATQPYTLYLTTYRLPHHTEGDMKGIDDSAVGEAGSEAGSEVESETGADGGVGD